MPDQGRGTGARVLVDFETSFKTAPAAASRKPRQLAIASADVTRSRPLNASAVIEHDRSESTPFRGNIDVTGSLSVPVDAVNIGILLKAAIGALTTTETPGTDNNLGGTIEILALGDVNFSVSQTTTVVGDMIAFTRAGVQEFVYVTAKADDDNMTVAVEADGTTDPATITATTIDYIADNLMAAATTIDTITNGVCTFDAAQTGLAVGQQIRYDVTTLGAFTVAYVDVVTSTTVVTLRDEQGFVLLAARDEAAVTLDLMAAAPRFSHKFTIDPTAVLPSLAVEVGFEDIAVPRYNLYSGMKIATFAVAFGGDGELLATIGFKGAGRAKSATAYTSSVAARELLGTKFIQFDGSIQNSDFPAALTTVSVMSEFSFNFDNQLDEGGYVIGGAGERRHLAEGQAAVSGALKALLEDTDIMDLADNFTTESWEAVFSSGSDSITFRALESKSEENDVAVPGAQGLTVDLNWRAFKTNAAGQTDSSSFAVVLVNGQPGY